MPFSFETRQTIVFLGFLGVKSIFSFGVGFWEKIEAFVPETKDLEAKG